MTTSATVVWIEIPVSNLDAGIAFYSTVFGFDIVTQTAGPNPIADFKAAEGAVSGHLYEGKPAADGRGPTIHLAAPDGLEATSARFTSAGGSVISPAITIPPGRFAYGTDPDGNSIGLFEAA